MYNDKGENVVIVYYDVASESKIDDAFYWCKRHMFLHNHKLFFVFCCFHKQGGDNFLFKKCLKDQMISRVSDCTSICSPVTAAAGNAAETLPGYVRTLVQRMELAKLPQSPHTNKPPYF